MQVTMTVNGSESPREVEPRMLLVHFIRETLGLTRHALGLRHLQLRRVRPCWVDGEPVKRCTMLAAMADGHEVTHRRGPGEATASSTRSSRASSSATDCSAASAPRA